MFLSARFMILPRRLATPLDQFGLLIEPQPERILEALRDSPLAVVDARILDVPLAQLRESLRRRLGLSGPLIVTGHQAEFFHAGVLAKAIAADALAKRCGGRAVFVTVDSDVIHHERVAVPTRRDGALAVERVAIPGCRLNATAESQPARPIQEWLDFIARLSELNAIEPPTLLEAFANGCRNAPSDSKPAGRGAAASATVIEVLDAGRAAILAELGASIPYSVLVSTLAATPEFRALAAHLLLHAASFASHYNGAQAAYRERHHVRSPQRPVPPLALSGDVAETPLWVGRAGGPRRRLAVRPAGRRLELLADGETIGDLPGEELGRFEWHRQPWPIERAGWQVRPRALALSAFLRLGLADVFIHGTGGARYDEITDELVRSFWGIRPPPLCCVTATLYPALGEGWSSPAEALAARRGRRDLLYNPQRHLRGIPDDLRRRRAELVEQSRALRAARPRDHYTRRRVFEGIRQINALMRAAAPAEVSELEQRGAWIAGRAAELEIALNREYFFALHSRSALMELARRIRARLGLDT